KFGARGLTNTLMGGGITGLAVGILGKLLNPLEEVEQRIKTLLGDAGSLVTMAGQFNTSAGNLAKLQALAGSEGIDEQALMDMLSKFQSAIANTRQKAFDPNVPESEKRTAVSQF